MKKQSLTERIVAFLKGGDEARLSRFEAKLNKYFDKQINMRKESIETLREKISDAQEILNESIVQVNTANLSTTDDAELYVSKYVKSVSEKLAVVEGLEKDIATQEEEIARFEKLRSLIYPEEAAQTK